MNQKRKPRYNPALAIVVKVTKELKCLNGLVRPGTGQELTCGTCCVCRANRLVGRLKADKIRSRRQ